MLGKILYLCARLQKKLLINAKINSSFGRHSRAEGGGQFVNCYFGAYSYCGYGCTFLNCTVGSFCSIADGVYVGGATHPLDFVSTSPVFLENEGSIKRKFSTHEFRLTETVSIGNDVWIGRSAIIKSGVSIGHGAVVGMGAVVTKDVEPYCIVGGNPAKIIRYRFDKDTRDRLLESAWWDLSEEDLESWARHFNSTESFLERLKK